MSLNGLRRRVATHDKTQTETQMHEPSIGLRAFSSGDLSFRRFCWSISLGFWSMRHSAISEDELDFQEHSVEHFFLV
jgi:hypothetical protein